MKLILFCVALLGLLTTLPLSATEKTFQQKYQDFVTNLPPGMGVRKKIKDGKTCYCKYMANMSTIPTTYIPETTPPVTTTPWTTLPTTTTPPTTIPITTKPPTTIPATTKPPTTIPPTTTKAPTTIPITTKRPTTVAATTKGPVSMGDFTCNTTVTLQANKEYQIITPSFGGDYPRPMHCEITYELPSGSNLIHLSITGGIVGDPNTATCTGVNQDYVRLSVVNNQNNLIGNPKTMCGSVSAMTYMTFMGQKLKFLFHSEPTATTTGMTGLQGTIQAF